MDETAVNGAQLVSLLCSVTVSLTTSLQLEHGLTTFTRGGRLVTG